MQFLSLFSNCAYLPLPATNVVFAFTIIEIVFLVHSQEYPFLRIYYFVHQKILFFEFQPNNSLFFIILSTVVFCPTTLVLENNLHNLCFLVADPIQDWSNYID